MKLSLIVGMTKNRVIGKNNELPWPLIKEDMANFRKITTGHAVIMGRSTYESIGKPLKNRINIVMTYQQDLNIDGCHVVNSLPEALEIANTFNIKNKIEEVFVIGGSSIYIDALPMVNKIYLTEVKEDYIGDRFFPDLDKSKWSKVKIKETDKVVFSLMSRKERNLSLWLSFRSDSATHRPDGQLRKKCIACDCAMVEPKMEKAYCPFTECRMSHKPQG